MSSQALSTARPRMEDAPPASARAGAHPAVLGLLSGVLLWFAFPPAGWSWLGWIALVPLFLLVPSKRSRLALYFGVWLGGLAFWLLALNWILCIDPAAALGWTLMAAVLSTLWPVFLALARLAVIRLKLPLMIAAPIIWVALEYIRAYMFTGFPWYYLAHTQYRVLPVIQIADFAGALGLSLIMAAVSAFVVDALTLPLLRPTARGPRLTRRMTVRIGSLAAVLVALIGYGLFRLGTARFEPGPTVALLQSNLLQRQKQKKPMTGMEILEIYQRLIVKAQSSKVPLDLIVWPETAYPFGFAVIDPKLSPEEFARQVHGYDPEGTPAGWIEKRNGDDAFLRKWTSEIGVPMMLGVTTYHFDTDGFKRYNTAMLLEPGKSITQSYHKLHLVPFGEYVPLLQTFPWLTALTPYRNGYVPSLAFGGVPSWFEQGRYRYATAICFEDTVPQVSRRLFAEIPDGRSPDVLLNLSNDGWFTTQDENNVIHASSEQEMHLAGSVFRAVEHRVPLARAANTGISAVIDGNGKVVAMLPAAKEDVLIASVPLDPRTGLYTRWGDWVGLFCLAITIGLIPLAWSRGGQELKPAPLPA